MPEVVRKEPVEEEALIDVDAPHVHTVPPTFTSQTIQTETQAARKDIEAEDRERAKARSRSSQQGTSFLGLLSKNSDNPVIIGNVVVSAGLAGFLGFQSWRWFQNGAKGGWGALAGGLAAIGVFGAADYFLTKYALRKYPTRK